MSKIYQYPSQLPRKLTRDLRFYCPTSKCNREIDFSDLSDRFSCPECEEAFFVKIVDGKAIPSIRRRGVSGYAEIVRMPELPAERRERFIKQHNLSREQAIKLTNSIEIADFYEEISEKVSNSVAATFISDTLLGELNYRDMTIKEVNPEDMIQPLLDYEENIVTWKTIVELLRDSLDKSKSFTDLYQERDVTKTEKSELEKVIEDIIQEEDSAVEDYRQGNEEAMNYIIGCVMSRTEGKAEAETAREIIKSKISDR
jgi:aspartyl-tRNA(Asn)/glutamyl-tRNA(Gln) amidotransferase subunit B